MADFMPEIARFQEWAEAIPPERRHGEWECEYERWGELYESVFHFTEAVPFSKWTPDEVRAVLYAVARDNELEYLASEIRSRQPETFIALAAAALKIGEQGAKWQIADQLGQIGQDDGEAKRLLLVLAQDEDEYVRRRALKSLALIGAGAVEELALAEWHRTNDNQQWARMGALWCLKRVGSSHLDRLLLEAEKDERQYLREFAEKIRRGEVDQ